MGIIPVIFISIFVAACVVKLLSSFIEFYSDCRYMNVLVKDDEGVEWMIKQAGYAEFLVLGKMPDGVYTHKYMSREEWEKLYKKQNPSTWLKYLKHL